MNTKVALIRYANVQGKGWRRGAAVVGKTGRIKHEYMVVGGQEVHAPNGRYQLRRYSGTRPVYTELGNDPADAYNRYKAEESTSTATVNAVRAGLLLSAPGQEERVTLKTKAQTFIAMHRALRHRAADALDAYIRVLASFQSVCPSLKYAEDITEEHIILWHGWMKDAKGYSDRTCANYYVNLRTFLRYCKLDVNKIIGRGTNKILKSYTKRVPNYYDPQTIATIIAAANDENRALMWDFFWKTGLRKSEMQMVTRFDFEDLEGQNPTLLSKERDEYGHIKDQEERRIELHPTLVAPLKKWMRLNPTKILVFGTEQDKPDGHMLLALKRDARRAGLNCGMCKGCRGKRNECGEFTLHRFRRTYCNTLLRATGNDFRSVMERSGHADIQTLMRYIAPVPLQRDAIAAAF